MAHHPKISQEIREILRGFLVLDFKLLHVLSKRDVKHFKYTYYITNINKITCNNNNFNYYNFTNK